MKKKTKFVIEPFDDIKIIGINTTMYDYQLAWNINKITKINLVKYKDISSEDDNLFSFYLYDAGENSNTFNLVALSNQETKWVSFSPQTDYLLIIRNYLKESDFLSLLQKIKSIPRIRRKSTKPSTTAKIVTETITTHVDEITSWRLGHTTFLSSA